MASNVFGSFETGQGVTVNGTQEVLGKKRFLNPDNEFEGVFVQPSIQANNTTISPTELSFLDGVTSNIQAQMANFVTLAQANTNYLGRLGTPTSLASVTTFNNGVVLGTSLTFPDTTVQTTAYTGGVNNTGVTTGAAASIPFLTNAASTIGQIVYTDSNGHFTYSPGTNTLRVGGTTNGAITVMGTASSLSVAGTGTAISTPNATAINFGTATITGGAITVAGTASTLSVAGTGTAISTPNATAINFGTATITGGAITVAGTASTLSVAGTGTAMSTPNATAINFGTAAVTGGSFSGNCNITNTNADANYYPVFVSGSGSQTLNADITTGPFVINPSTGTLSFANTLKIGSLGRIALGADAGVTNQGTYSVALGLAAGELNQGQESVAIGYDAGGDNQGAYSFAFGSSAGSVNQGLSSFAMGTSAGEMNQGEYSIAIGNNAAREAQGTLCVAIGYNASSSNLVPQGASSVSIGSNAGIAQGSSSVAIGASAAVTSQGNNCVAIGAAAGATQAGNSVAIGNLAGTSQGLSAVAVGRASGQSSGDNTVCIGATAGQEGQLSGAVAVGLGAGRYNQKTDAVAIGRSAGLGVQAGGTVFQGVSAIAIGAFAGAGSAVGGGQGANAIAIGAVAGSSGQGANAVAIGNAAGSGVTSGQGTNSIAIGFLAANESQTAGSICLNASGAVLNPNQAGLFVRPIRSVAPTATLKAVVYNPTTYEVAYSNPYEDYFGTITGGINVTLAVPLSRYYITSATAAIQVALPLASSSAGATVTFKKRSGASAMTFVQDGGGSAFIQNTGMILSTSAIMAAGNFCTTLVCDGVLWYQTDLV